jgi:hypothetical protein
MPISIRKLVCGGTQYYPQTCIQGVVDENGNSLGIDSVPTNNSDNLLKSGAVYAALNGTYYGN